MSRIAPTSIAAAFSDTERSLLANVEQRIRSSVPQNWQLNALEQFRKALEAELPHPIPRGISAESLARVAARSMDRFLLSSSGIRTDFREDLLDYASQFDSRRARIIEKRWGLRDGRTSTLEALGLQEGVTRERIRQLEQKLEETARLIKPPLLVLEMTSFAGFASHDVTTSQMWIRQLPKELRPRSWRSLKGLLKPMEFGWIATREHQGPFWIDATVASSALTTRLRDDLRTITMIVNRQLRLWGAVDLESIRKSGVENGEWLARAQFPSIRRAHRIKSWRVPRAPIESTLRRRLARVAAVAPRIEFHRLRRALVRSVTSPYRARRAPAPPSSVFAVLLRDQIALTIEDDGIVDIQRFARKTDLSPSEILAVKFLRTHKNIATTRALLRHFSTSGLSAASGSIVAARSPVIERVAYGVVAVTGSEIDQAVLKLREAEVAETAPLMLGYRPLSKDVIEVQYQPDRDLLTTSTFGVPAGVLPVGEWKMVTPLKRRVRVHDRYVNGLKPAVQLLLSNGEQRVIRVEFCRSRREIRVTGGTVLQ